MAKIAIIPIGVDESPIIPKFIEDSSIHFNIICSDILDFELPPRIENAAPIWHRHELRNVLKQIAPDKFTISSSLRNLLKENDILEMSEPDLGVTAHIAQIEQNSKDLTIAYKLLLEDAGMDQISLIPLVGKHQRLLALKHKKYAPLRYYYMQEELLSTPVPPPLDNAKRKLNDKKLTIEGSAELNDLRLSDPALKALTNSDLIILLPTDIISLGVLFIADELEKQLKGFKSPIVLLWPFNNEGLTNEIHLEIAETLEIPTNIEGFAEDFSFLTDYVIIDKSGKEYLEALRNAGCNVLLSDLWDDNGNVSDGLISTLLGVADISEADDDVPTKTAHGSDEKKETSPENEANNDVEASKEKEEGEENGLHTGKNISQLLESPEERGSKNLPKTKEIDINPESVNGTIVDEVQEEESKIEPETPTTKSDEKEKDSTKETVEESLFDVLDEEDWIDSVKRAIEICMKDQNGHALEWLVEQSTNDSDSEIQIAEHVISSWIDARSTTGRKKGAEMLATLAANHRETYLQILQRHMLQTVQKGQDDKRRLLLPLFQILFDVDYNLSEAAIKAITKDLASLKDDEPDSVLELAKLTILQLVIPSRRLSRAAIRVLLELLEAKGTTGPEIWNTLLAFDAGNVAIELVTNFSISKVEEITRRSNLLRFTGSYYSTITKVVQAWKEGDRAAISTATGSILPEDTLRKFERLELARKLDKLQMVQLTTLAESLNKDVETVERLVTELIVNDELQAEMKLIDEKMYLVAKKSN